MNLLLVGRLAFSGRNTGSAASGADGGAIHSKPAGGMMKVPAPTCMMPAEEEDGLSGIMDWLFSRERGAPTPFGQQRACDGS